jgi:photosystem II stability/assembly factor-like uncharacterized protein
MKTFRVISLLLLTGIATSALATWESVGPYGGQLRALDVAPTDEDIILVASNSRPARLFQSVDNGATWQDFGSLPYYVYTIDFDPTTANTIYLGTFMSIYKTTNGGADWSTYSVSDTYVNDLAIHPSGPSVLHVAAGIQDSIMINMGYFKSTNGGVTWTSIKLDTLKGVSSCVAVSNSNPNIVFVGGNSSFNNQNYPRVFKSTNGGASFTNISSNLPVDYNISSIAVHPTNPDIIYVTSFYPGGIYRTTNGGTSWTLVETAPFISSIVTTPVASNIAYAGADTVIYKSTNSGATWFNCGSGYPCELKQTRKVVASTNTTTDVYCVDMYGFSKSTNSGSSWTELNTGICLQTVLTFTCAPSAPTTIYVGLDYTGVIKTTDNGNNWTMLPTFLSCGNICSFAVDYTNPNIVLALEGVG